jgi:hypothetical protein
MDGLHRGETQKFDENLSVDMPNLKHTLKTKSHYDKKHFDAIEEEKQLLIAQNSEDYQSSSAQRVTDIDVDSETVKKYHQDRAALIEEVTKREFDSDIVLTAAEDKVDFKL